MTLVDRLTHSSGARMACLGLLITAAIASPGCGVQDDEQGNTANVEAAVATLGPSYVDGPGEVQLTKCNGTQHCCSGGYAMRGLNIQADRLWCAKVMQPWEEAGCFVDTATVRVATLHTCPVGNYMKGVHVGNNKLTCCPYLPANRPTSAFVNGNSGSVVINGDYTPAGAHTDAPDSSEHETTPSGIVMHVCHGGVAGATSVMEGLNGGNDDLLCAL